MKPAPAGGTLAIAMSLAAAAQAQMPRAPGPLIERTGPGATAPAAPAFAAPSPAPAPPPPLASAAESQPGAEAAVGGVRFTAVRLITEGAGVAKLRAGWRAEADSALDIQLDAPGPAGFDPTWVERQATKHLVTGAPVPLDRVTAVVQAINLAFVRNGYINSGVLLSSVGVPEGGVLELRLVYGRLAPPVEGGAPVTVAWGKGGRGGLSAGYIQSRMAAAQGAPLNAVEVERAFRLLAENPAIATVGADLRPSARAGEASLLLTVVPAPRYDLYLSGANSRSPSIGGERVSMGGSLRNLLTAGDLISGEVGVTADRPDYALGYEFPLLSPRTVVSLRGVYSEAAVVDAPLVPLDIRAREQAFEGGLTQTVFARPLIPREGGGWISARTFSVGMRLAYRRTETFLLGEPFSFSPGAVDGRAAYGAARLTADYVDRGVSQVTAVSFTLSQGLGGTSAGVLGVDSPDTDFHALSLQASYARRLNTAGLELRLRFSGQLAGGLLYSGERFAVGGDGTVRGYREALLLADEGAAASIELSRRFSLSGRGRDVNGVDWTAFTPSVFADGAVVRNKAGQDPVPDRLYSVGASLTWAPSDAVFARVTYARALEDAPQVGSRDLQDRGFSFRITIRPLLFFRRR